MNTTFTIAEVADIRRDAHTAGHSQGVHDERARVVRCYDACFANKRVGADELPDVLRRFALMLARGEDPQ